MNRRTLTIIKRGLLAGALGWGLLAAAPAQNVGGLADLRRQFETAIKETQQRGREKTQISQQKYVEAIETMEADLQDLGQLQALITLREEKNRFSQGGDIPKAIIVSEPEGLRQIQVTWRERMLAERRDVAQQIVTLGQKYMRDLSALQKALAGRGESNSVVEVRKEKDGLLDNNVLREALVTLRSAKSFTSEADTERAATAAAEVVVEPVKYRFYAVGKEPAVSQQLLRPLHLVFSSTEQSANAVNYQLVASVYPQTVEGGKKSGTTLIPRVVLTAKGKDVAAGSKMLLEYFSHNAGATSVYKKENFEIIPQPKLARGQAVVIDAAGTDLPYQPRLKKGEKGDKEFYGVIISLFSPEDKLIFQQCAPLALVKECKAELPAAKATAP